MNDHIQGTLTYRAAEEPEKVLEFLALQPGMDVIDLGCGCGFYTLPMAGQVGPDGAVYGVELLADALTCVQDRLDAGECPDCAPVHLSMGSAVGTGLEHESADLLLLAHLDFYAYEPLLPDNERLIAEMYRLIRPGGRLVVMQDMNAVDDGSVAAVYRNFQTAGFDAIRAHYFLVPEEADQVQGLRFGRVPGSTSVLYDFARPEQATLESAGRMLSTVPFTHSVTHNPIGIGRQ